jgi:hypothetical protein
MLTRSNVIGGEWPSPGDQAHRTAPLRERYRAT